MGVYTNTIQSQIMMSNAMLPFLMNAVDHFLTSLSRMIQEASHRTKLNLIIWRLLDT